MTWWQWTGGALAALLIMGVLLDLRRLPDKRLAHPLLGLAVCALLWGGGEVVTGLERSMFWEQLGIAILYTGAIFLPAFWWILTLRWATERGAPPPLDPDRAGRWPLLWAAGMWFVMLTNPWHGSFLTPVMGERNVYRPLWWAIAIPNYALVVLSAGVALRAFVRVRVSTVRRQALLLCAAGLSMLVANWIYVFSQEAPVNATLPVLTVSAAILAVGFYRERLFGLLPVAMRTIAEQDSDGLVLVGPGGLVAWTNPRARELLAPLTLSEPLRMPRVLSGLLQEPDGTAARGVDAGDLREWQQAFDSAGRLYRYGPDGERWLRVRGQPIRGRNGRLVALYLRIRDVTEEERAQRELGQARRLESVAGLARGVAHDFRNLLLVARGNAELLAADLAGSPELLKRTDRILQATRNAAELADQLDLYAGGGTSLRAPVEFSQLVAETASLSEPCRGELVVQLAEEPLMIDADVTQVRQAVACLCINAHEALPDGGGEVRVETSRTWVDPATAEGLVLGRARPPGEYAMVRVTDNGSGIEPDTQERIFEPFFSTRGKRRGIGLSTVLGIVRSHDGLLDLKSHPGRGSQFSLYFPLDGEISG